MAKTKDKTKYTNRGQAMSDPKLPKDPRTGTANRPEMVSRNVRQGLASGVRGMPQNPVGSRNTVTSLEYIVGKYFRKKKK